MTPQNSPAEEFGDGGGKVDMEYPWKSFPALTLCCALIAVAVTSFCASAQVGFLLGWLVGASLSPIAPAIAPFVFGLLAVIGIEAGIRKQFLNSTAIWRAAFVSILVVVFCISCRYGIEWGNVSRLDPYKSFGKLFGSTWEGVDEGTAAKLYGFRWRARDSKMNADEYEAYMLDVIRPILASTQEDRATQVDAVLSAIDLPVNTGKP